MVPPKNIEYHYSACGDILLIQSEHTTSKCCRKGLPLFQNQHRIEPFWKHFFDWVNLPVSVKYGHVGALNPYLWSRNTSGVTSKPAIEGHLKTGHRKPTQNTRFIPYRRRFRQAFFLVSIFQFRHEPEQPRTGSALGGR